MELLLTVFYDFIIGTRRILGKLFFLFLSDEPPFEIIMKYNYPAELDTNSQSTFLLSQFTELVSKLEIQDLQELNHKSSEMRLLLGKYTYHGEDSISTIKESAFD